MKTLMIFIITSTIIFAQGYRAINVNGEVKFQSGADEKWINVVEGSVLEKEAFVATGENSSVKFVSNDFTFSLNENSAISFSSVKKMSLDELLLALAMEDLINKPQNINNGTSENTAVYGPDESREVFPDLDSGPFGIKRLNGAMQLAKNGFTESAVIFAKETFRKYPDTKEMSAYRIFFADILYEKKLYEEALKEYKEIEKLELDKTQKIKVESAINNINKVLLSN